MVFRLYTGKKGRYMKLNIKSDGYKRGIRYIDFGKNESSKIRFLRKKPKELRRKK